MIRMDDKNLDGWMEKNGDRYFMLDKDKSFR
jgi:hypothetical protein